MGSRGNKAALGLSRVIGGRGRQQCTTTRPRYRLQSRIRFRETPSGRHGRLGDVGPTVVGVTIL